MKHHTLDPKYTQQRSLSEMDCACDPTLVLADHHRLAQDSNFISEQKCARIGAIIIFRAQHIASVHCSDLIQKVAYPAPTIPEKKHTHAHQAGLTQLDYLHAHPNTEIQRLHGQ